MEYTDFVKITRACGVVVRNWPLAMFLAPGKINSRAELEVLFRAWSSKSVFFYKMSAKEHDTWLEDPEHGMPIVTQATRFGKIHTQPPGAVQLLGNVKDEQAASRAGSSAEFSAPIGSVESKGGVPATNENSATDASPSTASSSPSAASSSPLATPDHGVPAANEAPRPALREQTNFVNTTVVTNANGNALQVVGKKPRKQRKDAGTKRGQNKRTRKDVVDNEDEENSDERAAARKRPRRANDGDAQ